MCEDEYKDYIYQSFWFKNEIKEVYYAGNGFSMFKKGMDIQESFDLAVDMVGDKDAFMPGLVKKIESLLVEGNFIYDYWEFGDEDFSLYWFIKKSVYREKMKVIRDWIKYEELDDLIWFEEQK